MAELRPRPRPNSWAHFCPSSFNEGVDRSGYFEPRRYRRGSIRIKSVWEGHDTPPPTDQFGSRHNLRLSRRLSTSREQAKRILRSVIAPRHTTSRTSSDVSEETITSTRRERSATTQGGQEATVNAQMRAGIRGSIGGPVSGMISRPSLSDDVRAASDATARAQHMNSIMPGTDPHDKPLASGSGVGVSINLAEPALFLQGFEQNDMASGNTAMLRGTLHLRVTKSAKIKAVTLKFRGRAVTKWPEGES